MNLTLWNKRTPLTSEFDRLHNELDRSLEGFFGPLSLVEPALPPVEGWLPPMDVAETDAEITIRADVPGVPAKDLNIAVTGNTLSISGEKETNREEKKNGYCRRERSFGSFRRSLTLPETADPEKVSAESDNGVLTVHIAKRQSAKPRQIEVKPCGKKVPVGA